MLKRYNELVKNTPIYASLLACLGFILITMEIFIIHNEIMLEHVEYSPATEYDDRVQIDSLVQDCSISSTMEILQFCTKL